MPLFKRAGADLSAAAVAAQGAEVEHWNAIERRAQEGERLFWLNHPRVAYHYQRKAMIDGLPWRQWLLGELGGPANTALELGCGNGVALGEMLSWGVAATGVGVDLDTSRFQSGLTEKNRIRFISTDLNHIELEEDRYDLIYALQSFHHFEALEHIMERVNRALTPRGYFVLDEYVGPARFQWTDLQLTATAQLLGLMPRNLRWYTHGIEKLAEGRSTPEAVIQQCPSEAIRSDEIVPLFYRYFDVAHHNNLGGTIQHLLYSGIVHNFPDGDPEVDHMIDCIDGIESSMIEGGILPADFALLVGRKRPEQTHPTRI